MIEKHPFEAFIPLDCRVLVIGSFPGKESTQLPRENDWFYGANRNQFWKILEFVYQRDLKTKKEKQELFEEMGIGITDIISACERSDNKNSDSNLTNKVYNFMISEILNTKKIEKVLFTGKGVYSEFIENFDQNDDIKLIVLPSPSPIFRRLSFQDKVEEYKKHFPNL
jgi:hypoxanthine-DNA glycosylase